MSRHLSLADMSIWAVALIFLAAAPQKIFAPAAFAVTIAGYDMLPAALIPFIALVLPWLELLLACFLVCRVWTGPALFLANALFVTFLGALGYARFRGLDVDCGCFSASSASASMTWYLVRDTLFLTVGLGAVWLNRCRA